MATLLASLVLKGAIVFALGGVAAALLRRSSASLRHGVWALTFAAALAVPALDAVGPSWRAPVLPAPPAWSPPAWSPPEMATAAPDTRLLAFRGPTATSASPRGATPKLPLALAWLWALGAVLVGARWARAYALARRVVRQSRAVDDGAWTVRAQDAARAVGLGRPVRLRVSDALAGPVAWGWGRPTVVLLPPESETWDDGRARAVLLHEVEHLRRRDAWTQAVAQAALVVHWPNPLAWVAYRQLRAAREQACDDAALRAGAPPPAYASHLVAAARALGPGHRAPAALAAMVAPDELETRVRAVLDGRRQRGRAGRRSTTAALGLAVAASATLAAVQPVAGQRASITQAAPSVPSPSAAARPHTSLASPAAGAPLSDGRGPDGPAPSPTTQRATLADPPAASGERVGQDTTDVQREVAHARRHAAAAQRELAAVRREADAVEREMAAVQLDADNIRGETARADREASAVQREADAARRELTGVRREAAAAARAAERAAAEAARAAAEAARVADLLDGAPID